MNNPVSQTIKNVFTKPAYLALTGIVAVAVFAASVLLPNYQLVFNVWGDASVVLSAKINLVFQLPKQTFSDTIYDIIANKVAICFNSFRVQNWVASYSALTFNRLLVYL